MKKKLFLIVAIIIIAMFACMALVACGDPNAGNNNGGNHQEEDNNGGNGNNGNIDSPNAPIKEFLDKWLNSSYKTVYQASNSDARQISGNIYWQKTPERSIYVEVTGKNKANCFSGPTDSKDVENWDIEQLDKIEDICEFVNINVADLPQITAPERYIKCILQ